MSAHHGETARGREPRHAAPDGKWRRRCKAVGIAAGSVAAAIAATEATVLGITGQHLYQVPPLSYLFGSDAADAAVAASPLEAFSFVMPSDPQSLPKPPVDDCFDAGFSNWAFSNGGTALDSVFINLNIRGNEKGTTIVQFVGLSVKQSSATTPAGYEITCPNGGNYDTAAAQVLLSSNPKPDILYSSGGDKIEEPPSFKLEGTDRDNFVIQAQNTEGAHQVEIDAIYTVNGDRRAIPVITEPVLIGTSSSMDALTWSDGQWGPAY